MKTADEIIKVARQICQDENFQLDENSEDGGSFKKVFKIIDSLKEEYALKVIKSTVRSERITREIAAIQKCNHPNIAKILKFQNIEFEGKNYDYIIEEYLGGGNLGNLLESRGHLKYDDAIYIGEKLISTIGHLKEKKLVHRDIKPENIMFRKSSIEPVLVDFSIVRDLAESSLTQSWLARGPGTPLYAAPEQLNNQKAMIDWRTDQFSLGIVLSISTLNFHPYQNNKSPMASAETVENISNRKRNKNFESKCRETNLPCLDTMTKPWPVERYRTPDTLSKIWNEQEKK